MKALHIALSFFVLALFFASKGCSIKPGTFHQSQRDLFIVTPDLNFDPVPTDPLFYADFAFSAIYETLVNYDPPSKKYNPGLAESWTISPDSSQWTFNIKKGDHFHDGTPVNANNIADSLNQFTLNTKLNRYFIGGMGPACQNIKSISLLDDYSLQITVKNPDFDLLSVLSSPLSAIVLPNDDQGEKNARFNGISPSFWGTGNYKITTNIPGIRMELSRHQKSPDNSPAKIIIKAIKEEEGRQMEIMANIAHIAEKTGASKKNSEKSHYTSISAPQFSTSLLAFNVKAPPFDQIEIRQALCHAIDRNAIAQAIKDDASISASFIPGGLGISQLSAWPQYDREKALELLRPNWKKIENLELWIPDRATSFMANGEKIANIIADCWKKIGISTSIIPVNPREMSKLLAEGKHKICLFGHTLASPRVEHYLNSILSVDSQGPHGANISHFWHPEIEELLRKMRFEKDNEKMNDYCKEISNIVASQLPFMPLFSPLDRALVDQTVSVIPGFPWGLNLKNVHFSKNAWKNRVF